MTEQTARELFDRLAIELALPTDWRLKFDNAARRFGQCRYSDQVISLSRKLVALNNEQTVSATIRHEIAHALVGPFHGHDEVWRRMAIQCGDDGHRCYDAGIETPPAPWTATCATCGKVYKRHRAQKSGRFSACSVCCRGRCRGRFSMTYVLNFEMTQPITQHVSDNPQVIEVLRLRATGLGYAAIDATFGIFGKKGWWSWKIVKTFQSEK